MSNFFACLVFIYLIQSSFEKCSCHCSFLLGIFKTFNLPCFSGGSTLYIETSLKEALSTDDKKSHPSLDVTGQLGDVMKESSHIAYTFAKVCILSFLFGCFTKGNLSPGGRQEIKKPDYMLQ